MKIIKKNLRKSKNLNVLNIGPFAAVKKYDVTVMGFYCFIIKMLV